MSERPRIALPPHGRGQRIGLFGGSFNPPHQGHVQASLFALKRLRLDQIWWLVTPGNPLKDRHELPPLADRVAAARRIARHPRIAVTDVEGALGTVYTVDTLRKLLPLLPGLRPVWIMGADNLRNFHRWDRWEEMLSLIPFAVVDRPGASLRVYGLPAAARLAPYRIPEHEAQSLPDRRPPAWVVLHGLKLPISSTALRRNRRPGVESGEPR